MADLDAKGMGKRGLGDHNDNTGCCVDFDSFIGGISFKRRDCHTVIWVVSNHFAISSRFRRCPRDMRSKRGANTGIEKDHHLKDDYVRFSVAPATSRKVVS